MPKKIIQQNPRDQEFVQNPYRLYRELHRSPSPVYWEDYGFWCLSSYEDVNRSLRDRRFARIPPSTRPQPMYGPHLADFAAIERYSLLALEAPDHTRLRKFLNHAFASQQLNPLDEGIRALAHQAIDDITAHGKAELLADYATPIPVTVITRLLGVPENAAEQLLSWSHAMVRVYTMTQTYQDELAANQAAAAFGAFVQSLLLEKRRTPRADLISHLSQQQPNGESLTDDEIISLVVLLLNAGHEATVHQLGNAIHTLLNHYPVNNRDELFSLLDDDESADRLTNECLRFDAPLHLFTRYAQEDLSLGHGVTLAAGDQLGLLLAAANHCPVKFDKPEQFLPLREDAANVSLGAGTHFCVGAHLAKKELRIALQVLFQRLPGLHLSAPASFQDTFHFHGLSSLDVNW